MFPRLPELQEISQAQGWGCWDVCAGLRVELDDPQDNSMILQFRGQQEQRISPKPNFPSISDTVFDLPPLSCTDRHMDTIDNTLPHQPLYLFAMWLQ